MTNRPPKKRYFPLWWLLLAISWLPFPALYLLSNFIYLVLYKVLGYRKKVVWQNLKKSFPEKPDTELKDIMAAFYRGLGDIILETVKLATISPEALNKRVSITNSSFIASCYDAGLPVLTLGSHLGNWEWALPAAAMNFRVPQEGIYKPLSNEFFDWFMIRLRTRHGGNLIKMKDTLRHLMRNRDLPVGVTMLADQTPPGGEIQYWTRFLNQDTPFFVGGEKLATTFKYPIFFFGARRVKRGYYEYVVEQLHDGKETLPDGEFPITEMYARRLEKWIRQYPSDYLWSHKRWKHKRPVAATS